jgi:hypothetical protein
MPYIKQERRVVLDAREDGPADAGELNYVLTTIIYQYWLARKRYQAINDIIGACQGAATEFYRRVAIPYENAKMAENGDCYQPWPTPLPTRTG